MIKRNPALVVIFSIITCGIYMLYWTYVVTRDIENELVNRDGRCPDPAMAVLFSIITCGIYTYYWWYCEGKRMAQLQYERGLTPSDNAVVYLVLGIVGLSVVSMVLLQSDINRVSDTTRPAGYTDGGANGAADPNGGFYTGGAPFNNGAPYNGTDPNAGYYTGNSANNGTAGSPNNAGADPYAGDPYNVNNNNNNNNNGSDGFNR